MARGDVRRRRAARSRLGARGRAARLPRDASPRATWPWASSTTSHHRPDGTPYARQRDGACDRSPPPPTRPASTMVLLMTAYERAGKGLPPTRASAGSATPASPRTWTRRRAGRRASRAGRARAAQRAGLSRRGSRRSAATPQATGMVVHIHACEQRREIEECLAEHGRRPVELLADAGLLTARTTIVHATHASDGELDLMAAAGATICACPTTESNLGDGYLPAERIFQRGIRMCIGSDSNTVIDPVPGDPRNRGDRPPIGRAPQRARAARRRGPTPYLLAVGSRERRPRARPRPRLAPRDRDLGHRAPSSPAWRGRCTWPPPSSSVGSDPASGPPSTFGTQS